MGSTVEARRAFVDRLKTACDKSVRVPPPNRGRQQYIAQQLGVAAEAVSKWFKGVSMPTPDKMQVLADLLSVEISWLQLGIDPEMDRSERKSFAREASGAVYLLMGLTMLSGANCAPPSERDPRHDDIDFMAIVRGRTLAVRVCMARDIGDDTYELTVPNGYEGLNCVALISKPGGKYDVLDMPESIIAQCKKSKNGDYSIVMTQQLLKYVSGDFTWPKIRYIGDR